MEILLLLLGKHPMFMYIQENWYFWGNCQQYFFIFFIVVFTILDLTTNKSCIPNCMHNFSPQVGIQVDVVLSNSIDFPLYFSHSLVEGSQRSLFLQNRISQLVQLQTICCRVIPCESTEKNMKFFQFGLLTKKFRIFLIFQ